MAHGLVLTFHGLLPRSGGLRGHIYPEDSIMGKGAWEERLSYSGVYRLWRGMYYDVSTFPEHSPEFELSAVIIIGSDCSMGR